MPLATPPTVLTIAGSDSGGAAGLAADLRTFAAYGVHGALAVAAVTVQDTVGVKAVEVLPARLLAAQIEAVAADLHPAAAKTGYLGSPANAAAVSALAAYGALPNLVLDPVLVSSSGTPLFPGRDMVEATRVLLASAVVATPNLPEAALLLGWDQGSPGSRGRPGSRGGSGSRGGPGGPGAAGSTASAGSTAGPGVRQAGGLDDLDAAETAARKLQALGPALVVVTGGRHRAGAEAVDVAFDGVAVTYLSAPFVDTPNVHGTGDSLSAALAAGLALGWGPLEAALVAKAFVHDALVRSATWHLGAGHGPIDHLDLAARRSERQQARTSDAGDAARASGGQDLDEDGSDRGAP